MNLDRIGIDCPLYEFDCSDIEFDIGEFYALSPNNGKLTLAHNGVTIGDFTANQQEDETINIVTPTSEDITNAVAGEALLRQQADNTLQTNINNEKLAREQADRDIQTVLDGESLARVNADNALQSQIDAIASKSDVVDVVANYAALQAYDTSKLNDNDVVKVLDDETHGDTMTYYRWNKASGTWSYIGQEAPYYSKSQMDTMLATKQDTLTAGTGIDITGATISADTTVLATKSELSNYAEKSDTYTKTEVDNLVEPKLSVEVVENLPATGEENKLYLTEKAKTIQTASGNPITATITDGAGNLSDFRLDGDTFQQTYTGKNLLGLGAVQPENTYGLTTTIENGTNSLIVDGTYNGGGGGYPWISYREGLNIPAGTYTLSIKNPINTRFSLRMYRSDGTYPLGKYIETGNTSATISIDFDCTRVAILIGQLSSGTTYENYKIENIQLEAGSSVTDFEPFVNAIPAPNPDYPQAIQTVTGEQTVTINSTDYPISLGSIELCKLGTFADYIYKDGNDWKVHKEIAKSSLSTDINWSTTSFTAQKRIYAYSTDVFGVRVQWPANNNTAGLLLISHFTNIALQTLLDGSDGAGLSSSGYLSLRVNSANTAQDILDIIDNNNVIVYGKMTATDTVITDSALIAQLEAIRTASLENGSNTLSNSATGSNLAGDMEISYYGYNPTNRYDKWLWLDINNSYEQLGS